MPCPELPRYAAVLYLTFCLILICSLLAVSSDGSSLSFTTFIAAAPGGAFSYSFGYRSITECWDSDVDKVYNECKLQSLSDYDRDMHGVCSKGGVGIIATYSLCIVVSVIMAGLLLCAGALPPSWSAHRVLSVTHFNTVLSVLLSALTVTAVAYWYSTCQAVLSRSCVSYANQPPCYPVYQLSTGSAMGVGITIGVLALVTLALSAYRSVTEWRRRTLGSVVANVAGEELLTAAHSAKFARFKDDDSTASAAHTRVFVA